MSHVEKNCKLLFQVNVNYHQAFCSGDLQISVNISFTEGAVTVVVAAVVVIGTVVVHV